MNDFVDATDQIRDAFKTEASARWVRGTGRREMVNALLAAMRNARSQEQFDNLAYQFKRDVLMPYYREVVMPQGSQSQRTRFLERNTLMQMRPRKELGSYEDLWKNPAFAQTRHRMTPRGSRESVPALLRVMQDPAETDLAARELGMTPEDLRSYVQEKYNERAREQFRKDMMTAAVEGQRYRDSLAKDYENSILGTVLGTIAPEVTGYYSAVTRNPEKENKWDLAKAIAKDALVGIGSLYAPAAAGKVVSNPLARNVLGGVFDAGIEAARQGMSDYYGWDPANIAAVGGVSATLPALIGGAAAMGSSIPGMGRLTRPIMRKLRMMQADPADVETAASRNKRDQMFETIRAAESGDPLAKEVSDDMLEQSRDFIEKSHANVLHEGPLTTDDLRDIVMDPALSEKYFNPPTAEQFRSAVETKKYAGADDVIDVNGRTRFESDVAEDWLNRAKHQWPENYKKSGSPAPSKTKLDKVVDFAVDAASREETMRQRTQGKKLEDNSVSLALQQVMEYDPDMIRMWNAGFAPHDEAGKKLYDEWKQKFGGQQ